MTEQHKATPEQWDDAGAFASATRACLLELRARIEALEVAHQPRVFTAADYRWIVVPDPSTNGLRSYSIGPAKPIDELGEGHTLVSSPANSSASLTSSPAGSLVERIGSAAILELAAAALQMHPDKNLTWERVALWLEQEANR